MVRSEAARRPHWWATAARTGASAEVRGAGAVQLTQEVVGQLVDTVEATANLLVSGSDEGL